MKKKKKINEIVIGVFQKSRNFGFVIPDDKNIKGDIFISKKKFGKAKNNDKVAVQIVKYPTDGKKAEGKIVEILGKLDNIDLDMLNITKEFGLENEFPKEIIKYVQKIPQKVDYNSKNRRDFRNDRVFTIDGEDAKDLDDAIHVEKLENGNYILDVHIADVSNYVEEDSILDKEAILRGTSVYMFDRVIPMLPLELSNGICSLNAGEDRFALSCLMEIDQKGKVISSDVCKSIIKVTKRMSYTEVKKILNNEDENVLKKYEKYIPDFKLMEELAQILKNRRNINGYLNLDIPESKIILDKKGRCVDVTKYETSFANEIIEQFMLTANETIAEKFYWLEAPFIYRVHEEPDMDKIKETNKFLFDLGYKIKASKDNIKPKAFSDVLSKIKNTEYEKVVSTLILRTLKVARYEEENKGHFGIASKFYCHFTSPIRRYPDLFIHRVISEYIKKGYNLSEDRKEELRAKAIKYAEISSDCEKVATKAEREAEAMKKAEFMEKKIGMEFDGIVSSVTSFGMFVELENTVEGLVRFENMGNEYFIFDEASKKLIGENSKKTYKIGDKVCVKVLDASKSFRKVSFELVNK